MLFDNKPGCKIIAVAMKTLVAVLTMRLQKISINYLAIRQFLYKHKQT